MNPYHGHDPSIPHYGMSMGTMGMGMGMGVPQMGYGALPQQHQPPPHQQHHQDMGHGHDAHTNEQFTAMNTSSSESSVHHDDDENEDEDDVRHHSPPRLVGPLHPYHQWCYNRMMKMTMTRIVHPNDHARLNQVVIITRPMALASHQDLVH